MVRVPFFCLLICALSAMHPVFAQSPVSPEMVVAALKQNDLPKAVDLGAKLTAQKPNDSNAWGLYISALQRSGENEKALQATKKARESLTDKKDQVRFWCVEGDADRTLGATEEATKAYITALGVATNANMAPQIAMATERMAWLDYSREQYPIALQEFQDSLALEKDPLTKATIRSAMARIYSKQKKYDAGLALLKDGASADHQVMAEQLLAKGEVLAAATRFQEADATLQKATQESRLAQDHLREAYGLRGFGYLYLQQGNRETALLKFRKALEVSRQLGEKEFQQEMEGRCAELQNSVQKTFGAIDIGSKGVKGVLVDYYKERNQPQTKEVTRIIINTDLLTTMTADKTLSPAAMAKTVEALLTIARGLRDKRVGVKVNSITVGGSSGVAQAKNLDELMQLINQGFQNLERGDPNNINCNLRPFILTRESFISSADELYYGILGSVPADKASQATLLDIGSSNGRIGYLAQGEKGLEKVNIELELGTVALTNAAKRSYPGEPYEAALQKSVAPISSHLQKAVSVTPGLTNRGEMYLVGGAAWAMTTFLHPGQANDGYVEITPEDIGKFYDVTLQNRQSEFTPDLSSIADAETRAKATAELKSVRKVFDPDNLLAASLLLKTVRDSGAIASQHLYFSRFGGWALGLAQTEYIRHQPVE